ncbi:precorrin-6y C5,15-methyltransferase (decarboxylating) subunit CbiE [Glycomyces sp. TRM65418]|uniref:precorrin-6y C5,15-methyltransferase (decarboxylating) subunit CbiE n=1 Tax=Glycomyces sp. TRM65418 TaxID=2867006 RepID=UPI001CE62F9C|nr:precorrin-6y C5,15-methyltransferase (decarboxylating) subunit CbiE [Glycomyces sp. TRM65418]MCC3764544.1 precorrin-6y C5,15-methyltransferase (decarboxylating) subunit CbiE [Glycomyces sp. TRM65418]QZD54211.1 precorrin-6y C5,15-methyltransferase (decarboxylating) subunit CbiE [Glycomyces sp. TRM65418]
MNHPLIVIGVGPDGRLARPIPAEATVIAGGRRHLEAHAPRHAATIAIGGDLDAAVAAIEAAPGPVAVLASGDPGWFGILRRLAAVGRPLTIHPAASSVSGAFARIGLSWEDAQVVSAHGRDPRPAIATALCGPKVAVLTDARTTPAVIARALVAAGSGPRDVVVAGRLGHPDETLDRCGLAEAAGRDFPEPNVMLVLDPAADARQGPTLLAHSRGAAAGWGRPVDEFAHRDGQITKPAVRAAALAALGPGPGRLLWDVGCGSGSVAVEAARLGAGVVAVDADGDQLDRARANAVAHGVRIGLVHGRAPDALAALPDPDAVFIGGGGAGLESVIDAAAARCGDRIVIALATLERCPEAVRRLETHGWKAAAQLLEVADLVPLGDGHRLAPRNPVLLVQGERP